MKRRTSDSLVREKTEKRTWDEQYSKIAESYVGKRFSSNWRENGWMNGFILEWDDNDRNHILKYDNGSVERCNLVITDMPWKFIDLPFRGHVEEEEFQRLLKSGEFKYCNVYLDGAFRYFLVDEDGNRGDEITKSSESEATASFVGCPSMKEFSFVQKRDPQLPSRDITMGRSQSFSSGESEPQREETFSSNWDMPEVDLSRPSLTNFNPSSPQRNPFVSSRSRGIENPVNPFSAVVNQIREDRSSGTSNISNTRQRRHSAQTDLTSRSQPFNDFLRSQPASLSDFDMMDLDNPLSLNNWNTTVSPRPPTVTVQKEENLSKQQRMFITKRIKEVLKKLPEKANHDIASVWQRLPGSCQKILKGINATKPLESFIDNSNEFALQVFSNVTQIVMIEMDKSNPESLVKEESDLAALEIFKKVPIEKRDLGTLFLRLPVFLQNHVKSYGKRPMRRLLGRHLNTVMLHNGLVYFKGEKKVDMDELLDEVISYLEENGPSKVLVIWHHMKKKGKFDCNQWFGEKKEYFNRIGDTIYLSKNEVHNEQYNDDNKPSTKPEKKEENCVICYSNLIDIVIVPCGHFAICSVCSPHFEKGECPICRNHIMQLVKIYRVS